MPLHDIQSQFIDSLMRPDFDETALLDNLKAGKCLLPARQLDIYRRNLNGAMQGVLGQVYPACCRILGEAYFNQLCRSYRFKHPSDHADLNLYGEHFPDFLSHHIEENEQLDDFVYLPDLAALEWRWHAAYYASNDAPFDFAGLQELDASQQQAVVFELAVSASLLKTPYPIMAIWQANRQQTTASQEFNHDGSETYYLIHRQEFEPQVEQLSADDYTILQAMQSGKTMAELSHQFAGQVGDRLPAYIQRGWITGHHLARA